MPSSITMSTRPQSIELMQDNTLRLLERITNSREEGRLFLEPDSVPKARAQELVNDIQLWLDRHKEVHYLWRSAIYMLYGLMIEHKVYPASMMVGECTWTRSDETLLAHGGGGSVYIGSLRGEPVAVKQVRFLNASKKLFLREVVTWKQLDNRFILPLCGIAPDQYDPMAGNIMVSPCMSGTLTAYIRPQNVASEQSKGRYYPKEDRRRLMQEIAEGISYLHARKIIHGDLKDANILMDHEDHVRIADFGLSLIGDETRGRLETTGSGSGSPGWMAPEAYEHETARRRSPADVYAFGLLCYMLITGTAPFRGMSSLAYLNSVVNRNKRRSRPTGDTCLGGESVSDELWDMINRCWRPSPGLRITMKHVLAYLNVDPTPIFQPHRGSHFVTKASRSVPAEADDGLSCNKGDTIEVMQSETDRWYVRNSDGMLGFISKKHLVDPTLVRATARFAYTPSPVQDMKHLSMKVGDRVDIVAFHEKWWLARNAQDGAGLVPANYLKLDWSSCSRPEKTIPMKAIVDYQTERAHHVQLRRGQDVELIKGPDSGHYYIVKTDVIGIVPSHLVAYDAHDDPIRIS